SPISFLSPTPPCGRSCDTCAGSATGRRPSTSARTASWRTPGPWNSGRSPAVSPYSDKERARALLADEPKRAPRTREPQRTIQAYAPQRAPRTREPERTPRAPEPRQARAATAARASVPPSLLGTRPLGRAGQVALTFALLSGLATHGYHLFEYP